MSVYAMLFMMGSVAIAVACAAMIFDRLSGLEPGWSTFLLGVWNWGTFIAIGKIEIQSESIGVEGLVTLAVLAQLCLVAWRQRLRERRIHRAKTEDTDERGSLDPTVTTVELSPPYLT